MFVLHPTSTVQPEEDQPLRELIDFMNDNGFMQHLRNQELPSLSRVPDGRGNAGCVMVTDRNIARGELVAFTNGSIIVRPELADRGAEKGNVDAVMYLSVGKGLPRGVSAVFDLKENEQTPYYFDHACDGGNLCAVTTAIGPGKSYAHVVAWYANIDIAMGNRLSFNYYQGKQGRARNNVIRHCPRRVPVGFVRCDCCAGCPNAIVAMD